MSETSLSASALPRFRDESESAASSQKRGRAEAPRSDATAPRGAGNTVPVLWTVGGSDSSGGAGIQTDVRTAESLGVHASTVVTATTAQGLGAFGAAHPVSASIVLDQLAALSASLEPRAVKLGMLGSAEIGATVLGALEGRSAFVVVDPVLRATSGGGLADQGLVDLHRGALLRRADLVTPNASEASTLLGRPVDTVEALDRAAHELVERGARAVLLKGGHVGASGDRVLDRYVDRERSFWLAGDRHAETPRGTGCALATAIAAFIARGQDLVDAVVAARAHVARGIRMRRTVAPGAPAVLGHGAWPVTSADVPAVLMDATAPSTSAPFPSVGPEPLGFYPVVDRAAWIERLAAAGATTAQLRVKDLDGDALSREVEAACAVQRVYGVRLFVNDFWRLAIAHGAYGVHLGQEDLDTLSHDDLQAIARAGLRLGVSTHSYYEAARAQALRPSYIALGPIFETTCKSMRFGPQGMARIDEWRALFDAPLVAIGGLTAEHAAEARARGADGVAVISDVTRSADPDARARTWVEAAR